MGSDGTGSTWSREEGGLKVGEEARLHLIMRVGRVTQREWEGQEDEVPSQLEQVGATFKVGEKTASDLSLRD